MSDLLETFRDIVERVPVSIFQKAFKLQDLTAGQTGRKTLDKVEGILSNQKDKRISKLFKIKDWYLNDYMLHGEKSVYFYKLKKEDAEKIIKFFLEHKISPTVYSKKFPLTVDDEYLSKDDKDTHVVDIRKHGNNAIAIVFSTVRFYTQRINIPKEDIKDDIIAEYDDVEELMGVRHLSRQFFDACVIYPDGSLEIRLDNPKMDNSKQLPPAERRVAFATIIDQFKKMVIKLFDDNWELPQPRSVINVIDNIYFAENEGNVRFLSFTTNNSNAKTAKSNRKRIDDCCRNDVFTQAGTKAVDGDINPYRIHVNWERSNKHYVELQILGTIDNLEVGKYPLNETIITRTLNQSDYEFVREKILKYQSDETSI